LDPVILPGSISPKTSSGKEKVPGLGQGLAVEIQPVLAPIEGSRGSKSRTQEAKSGSCFREI
jgi:hypothetical protein